MLRERTGLSESEIKQLESRGRLKRAKKDAGGWALYPESIVFDLINSTAAVRSIANMPALFDGEQSAAVFKMLRDGMSISDITIETAFHPNVIEAILKAYQRATGWLFVSKDVKEKLETLFAANFPIDSADALYDIVEAAATDKKCVKCSSRQARVCMGCMRRPETTGESSDKAIGPDDPPA